jgi:uncharacterized phage protein gp47/JayE
MPVIYNKSKDQILSKILSSLQQNAGITATYPGSVARALAEAMAVEIGDLYEAIKFSVEQTSLSMASGRSLDLIGDLYGVFRRSVSEDLQQERASFNISFSIDAPHSSNVVIPKDTLIYNDVTDFSTVQYQYKLVDAATIIAGTTRAFGRVIPNFSSTDFTASKGTLTKHNYIAPSGIIVYCTNTKEIYSMINMESDDMYRKRIVKSIKANSFGTAESLRMRALGVQGVRDVRVRESSYGLGSCDIIVVPESQRISTNLVNSIFNSLSEAKPVGIKLNVRIAERAPVHVAVSIVLPSGVGATTATGIENQASLFLRSYLNSRTIGDSISNGDIESIVRSSSDLIKSVNVLSVSVNGQEVPKGMFTINDDRQYMVAGSVSVFSVIMSSITY